MGLFSRFFQNLPSKEERKLNKELNEYFALINAYSPRFYSTGGGLYEMDLTRSAINVFASHISKLRPSVRGWGSETIGRMLAYKPNPIQDTTKFLYQLATIYQVQNNVFIVPLKDNKGNIFGLYPVAPDGAEVKHYGNELYLVYKDYKGSSQHILFSEVGVLNQYQYKNPIFGESNKPINEAMELIHTQNQGIRESIVNSANLRFIARLGMSLNDKDLKKERERLHAEQLSTKNKTGMLLLDQKYEDIKELSLKQYVAEPEQIKLINERVFIYFGINENILKNQYSSDDWTAYYEGKIEPFCLQLSLVLTNMFFSEREKSFGNEIIFTANRLNYLSNKEKIETITKLFDRGFISHNEGLEILNMPPIGDEGDKRYIRKEYLSRLDGDIEESESSDTQEEKE